MVSDKAKQNAGYLQIVLLLKNLLRKSIITKEEYERARNYYITMTGADLVLTD